MLTLARSLVMEYYKSMKLQRPTALKALHSTQHLRAKSQEINLSNSLHKIHRKMLLIKSRSQINPMTIFDM